MSIVSARSRASRGSRGGRYRTVAYTSEVDDTLFGDQRNGKPTSSNPTGAPIVNRRDILRLTGQSVAGGGGQPTVVLSSDMERIKDSSTIKTAQDLAAEKQAKERVQAERMQKARARKERMQALEAERKKHVPLSVLEKEDQELKKETRKRAVFLRDEQLDDVKTMNTYAEYAKTVTIRDQQLLDKKRKVEEEKKAERIRDLEMEIARLEMIKTHSDREKKQREDLIAARKHIEVQMEEHRKQVEAEREAVRREQAEMVERMKRQAEEEERKAEERARKQERLRAEILASNEEAIANKRRQKELEREEEQQMIEYQKRMAEEKAAKEAAEEEARQARELEFAKLRAAQQRMMDNRGAIDELRARRAFEAGERAAREKAAREAKKRQDDLRELARVREEQRRNKEEQMALLIAKEKEEFERIRRVQEEMAEQEKATQEAKRQQNLRHKDELIGMIQTREQERRKQRQQELQGGKEDLRGRDEYLSRVREIRERKVQELVQAGVDPKYTVQLAKHDPMKNIMKDYKLGAKMGQPGS